MAKTPAKTDSKQLSLFDQLQRAAEAIKSPFDSAQGPARGSLDIDRPLRLALSEAIKLCPLSVHQIAGEMSHLLNETITADMIYSWTAESKTQHQIWGVRLAIFCRVTKARRPMEVINEAAGYFCLPGPEALRAEIQQWRETEHKAGKERRKREMFLAEMEGV